ncbi:collagen alpha-3(VI) chain-like isoform X2 [Pleuronectes platessa]|uniref:collagen alpha-3(VI) chain-like isoform X2 n=1 Tax=Pleuronectes platessa TaxID=8262 RepID=UPI00232A6540|nr:collagen alpha-3(VI) chain-like isoform X2 [Pleuronectes platessa]
MTRDIVFLIDGSDDVGSRFSAIREFVAKMVDSFDLDQGKDKVAVVQYSNNPELNFNLNTYNTREEVFNHVTSLKPKGGRPQYIGKALQFVRDNVFVPNAGSRRNEGAKQILIVFAGGRSKDSPRGPASMLKAAGIVTFAVGSRLSNSAELQVISSERNYTYSISDFVSLPRIQQNLMSHLNQVGVEEETEGVQSDEKGRDIVFLLDGSDSTRNAFSAIQDFLYNIIERFEIGLKKDRVAVIQFSNLTQAEFFLNSFTRREDVLTAVRKLSHKGGRPLNTGAALQYLRDNVLTASAGSRRLEGVPQVLILLNGGKSSDNVDTPASALKQQGVFVIGIGTSSSDINELQKISSDPSLTLSVTEFTELPSVQEQLSSVMSTVLVRATPVTPAVTGKKLNTFYIPRSV